MSLDLSAPPVSPLGAPGGNPDAIGGTAQRFAAASGELVAATQASKTSLSLVSTWSGSGAVTFHSSESQTQIGLQHAAEALLEAAQALNLYANELRSAQQAWKGLPDSVFAGGVSPQESASILAANGQTSQVGLLAQAVALQLQTLADLAPSPPVHRGFLATLINDGEVVINDVAKAGIWTFDQGIGFVNGLGDVATSFVRSVQLGIAAGPIGQLIDPKLAAQAQREEDQIVAHPIATAGAILDLKDLKSLNLGRWAGNLAPTIAGGFLVKAFTTAEVFGVRAESVAASAPWTDALNAVPANISATARQAWVQENIIDVYGADPRFQALRDIVPVYELSFESSAEVRAEVSARLDGSISATATLPGINALHDALVAAPSNAPVLYRGFTSSLSPTRVARLFETGGAHDLGLASFSSDQNVALLYANRADLVNAASPVYGLGNPGNVHGATSVLFTVEPGSQALNISAISGRSTQSEWLAGGTYTVDRVGTDGNTVVITVHQTTGLSPVNP